jgi:autonomous glycyl radical cofactor GrcA
MSKKGVSETLTTARNHPGKGPQAAVRVSLTAFKGVLRSF